MKMVDKDKDVVKKRVGDTLFTNSVLLKSEKRSTSGKHEKSNLLRFLHMNHFANVGKMLSGY